MSVLTDQLRGHVGNTKVGLLFEQERYTHGEMVQAAATRAAIIAQLVEGSPRHIGVLLPNVPETMFWLEGALLAGATIVGLNSTRRGAELVSDIEHTDCAVVVTDDDGAGLLREAGVDVRTLVLGTRDYRRLLDEHAGATLPDVDVPDDRPAVLIFTSGTTSAPKAAIRSHGALAGLSERLVEQWSVTADDIAYNAMPWFHSNALYHAVFPTIGTNGTLAFRRKFSASAFIDDVRTFRATRFNYVGKVLEYILATPPTPVDRDNQLRIATGSEASERDIAAFSERFDTFVFDGFGSTEGGISIMRTSDMPPGALGLPASDDIVVMNAETNEECPRALFDETGRLTNAADATGELVNTAGMGMFEGYYKNDAASSERARDGWYWSGDLGYRDEAGYFYFAGRGYDWLRVDGENLSAALVERVMLRHPDLLLVGAYAVPDPNTGDQLMLAIQMADGATFDSGTFAEFLDAQTDIGTKWRPKFIRVSQALPMSHTNKLQKIALRDEAWRTDDPVWWRPGRDAAYVPLTPDDVVDLDAAFADAGRAAFAPSRPA